MKSRSFIKRIMAVALCSALVVDMGLPTEPVQAATLSSVDYVTVNAQDNITTIPDAIFGNNISEYVPQCDGSNTKVNNLMAASGEKIMRFPGGSYGDVYDWKKQGTTDWKVSTDEAIKFTNSFGGQLQPIVNFSGFWVGVQHTPAQTVQFAVDWVKYLNVTKKLGTKYWEVGNEIFGSWETGYTNGKDYGTRFADFYKAMKAADPTISIGAVGVGGDENNNYWNRDMLLAAKAKGVVPDFLAIHAYPGSKSSTGLDIIKSGRQDIKAFTNVLDKVITKYLGASYVGKIKYNMTEYNTTSSLGQLTFVNALFISQYMMEMAENKWGGANMWSAMNGNDGLATSGDFGFIDRTKLTPRPSYFACSLLANKFGRKMVSTSSTNIDIASYSAKDADENLTVLLINNSLTKDATTSVRLNGFVPSGQASKWVLEGSGQTPTGTTGAVQDLTSVKINNIANPDPLTIKSNLGVSMAVDADFPVTLPKASITLIKIKGSLVSATPVVNPVPVKDPTQSMVWNFEDGQTSVAKWSAAANLTLSSAVNPVAGGKCLKISMPLNSTSAAKSYALSTTQKTSTFTEGATVNMKVYIPSSSKASSFQLYYVDNAGGWHGFYHSGSITGEFVTCSFTVPKGQGPLKSIGLLVSNNANTSGYFLLDDITVTPKQPVFRPTLTAGIGYTLKNKNTGYTLGTENGALVSGTNIIQGSMNPQWLITEISDGKYKIINEASKMALEVVASSKDNLAYVDEATYTGAQNQLWKFINAGYGYLRIKNVNSGKVLDLSSLLVGSKLIVNEDCNLSKQTWSIQPVYKPNLVSNATYYIQNRKNYINLGCSSTANASLITQHGTNNKWKFIEVFDGEYKIINATSGLVLDVSNGSLADGAKIVQWPYSGSKNQLWTFIPSTKDFVKIKNVKSGQVLDLSSLDASGNLIQSIDEDRTQEMWKLIEVK